MDDETTLLICDVAAHQQVLSEQLRLTLQEIARRYPNNQLGGLLERLGELSAFAGEQAQALGDVAQQTLQERPEVTAEPDTLPGGVPAAVLQLFEQARIIADFPSLDQAAELVGQGHFVVIRDRAVQADHKVQRGAVAFSEADALLVRLWWPRVFSRTLRVSLLPTGVQGVMKETTMQAEDLPGQ